MTEGRPASAVTAQPAVFATTPWSVVLGAGGTDMPAVEDPQAAEVVQLRYFVGMTVPEIANALDLAPRTVDRHWAFARAWLKRTIRSSLSGPAGSD